ncbi:hypothetical protein USDA257_p01730 (plasmid) [Sinorhizobium fredii USDA 257]|uniref:Acyl-homoserine-lactone synthase n=1 Tax=Sinorhizobium fredii (strain USDA 257) TaxID=1185652 RepID=I3XG84_SINF2|nr:hypothetical protein USDA257_p01730 [Sinorhizobium fredii USDA 257]
MVLSLFSCESYRSSPTAPDETARAAGLGFNLRDSPNQKPCRSLQLPSDSDPCSSPRRFSTTKTSMQVIAISAHPDLRGKQLLEQHHRRRARVFSDRLGWEVSVLDGGESDAFDGLQPTYIITVSDSGHVAGCARLLPALGPAMTSFPRFFRTRD